MFSCEKHILKLDVVKYTINFAVKTKKIACIGVDGPTASGKTVFANLLKKEIQKLSNKSVQIIALDALLIERSFREKSLLNINHVGMPFEHEAEIHMNFSKFEKLLQQVKINQKILNFEKEIVLENLYSRSDNGKCIGKLKINLTNNTVLIFEGHYTTRPEFNGILDKNFILLAERKKLIKRKINRVANYRDQKEVEQYFNLIDEPSYLSNYYRFAANNSFILDNSDFSKPFSVGYDHINTLLDTKKFLENHKIPSKKIKEFIFGLHGLSIYSFDDKNNIEDLLLDLNDINFLESKKTISKLFSSHEIIHKIFYFDYLSKNEIEVGLVCNLFEKNVFWIIRKSFRKIQHLLFWEGGVFKINNGIIERLDFINKQDEETQNLQKDFYKNLREGKCFLSSVLLKHNFKGIYEYCFLDNINRVSFLGSALNFTQFSCSSLGEFFIISHRVLQKDFDKKFTSRVNGFKLNKTFFKVNNCNYYYKKSSGFSLSDDFLTLHSDLNINTLKELKEIYFNSEDIKLRSAIIEGLLHEENSCFISKDICKYLNYSICFFPVSMSRLYILKKMGFEQSNVLATSIYDITDDPIDTSTYLYTAFENNLPIILQASLNAIGQSELKMDGSKNIGYLLPKNGVYDFTNSICDVIVKILDENIPKNNFFPLIGIGLDHIDVRGNFPEGRSSRFIQEAFDTECITHLTIDGSEYFKPINKDQPELYNAYLEVFIKSLEFLGRVNINAIDFEFCTGELNYIGNESLPHYPCEDEISMLPICFSSALSGLKDLVYKADLLNTLKLYVANLGTTHHGYDEEKSLKLGLAEDWQKALEGTNFISPVLHGTTGSSENTFLLASKSCYKINIAGSFLQVLLENLNLSQKNIIGFNSFDEKSKYLCSKFNLIKKDKNPINKKELKKEFLRYCKLNNVKQILKNNQKVIRKPLFGRNKIALHIFSKLEQMVIS